MSSYLRKTKNPKTGKFEDAFWLDDYFGHHNYGVMFLDGEVYNIDKIKLETNDKKTKAKFEDFGVEDYFKRPEIRPIKISRKIKREREKPTLRLWESATQALAEVFVYRYFGEDAEHWWVADDIGGVLAVNDHFFNIDIISEAIRYNASSKKLFDFYDLELERAEKGEEMKINFRSFLKL